MKRPIALTIAGSDSSGGAGIQADLKTFSALGVYGATVLTAITAQNTTGVQGVEMLPAAFVDLQIESVLGDLEVAAIKTGMLGSADVIRIVARHLAVASQPSVVDPVMVATSGDLLIELEAVETLKSELLSRATLVTPNLDEAARLLNASKAQSHQQVAEQGRALIDQGCRAVLMKGGHGDSERSDDLFVTAEKVVLIEGERIDTANTHGTGCTLASAITAHIAAGFELEAAVRSAKLYITRALQQADALGVGQGAGPVDHLYAVDWPRP